MITIIDYFSLGSNNMYLIYKFFIWLWNTKNCNECSIIKPIVNNKYYDKLEVLK